MGGIFYESVFDGNLNIWTPYNLEDSTKIIINCSCPIPYWGNLETNQDIRKAIESYQLNKKLSENLSENNINKKNYKI